MSFVIPNTLQVHAVADAGCIAHAEADVVSAQQAAARQGRKFVALGEGSNIVPQSNVASYVCVMRLYGVEILDDAQHSVRLRVGAGQNWHQFVMSSLSKGWFGLENLALIPGSVGAAPVQNIGAYGVEFDQFVAAVEVLDAHGSKHTLSGAECGFSYRDSIFKKRSDLTIVAVVMRLSKVPEVTLNYPELIEELAKESAPTPTPEQLADAVIKIRQRKLPDPQIAPNVGSFFKNPVIDAGQAADLKQQFPELNQFVVAQGIKLNAAQLIDWAGWKNKPGAQVACWQSQPLVLVNTNNASAEDVLEYARGIQADIAKRYGVQLELEPSLLS